jgi:hypothetical protein
VADYLPLCAFRQDLLPVACRSCAWWLTSGAAPAGRGAAYGKRRQWMASLEPTWGSTGLIHAADPRPGDPSSISAQASVQYAPAAGVARLRGLPLGPLPSDSVLIFCLRVEGESNRPLARRLLQKALAQLRLRGAGEVYAFAAVLGGTDGGEHCEFFPVDLLEDTGFRHVRDNGDLYLMRADLGGLATLFGQLETAMRKVLGTDPAPSPAALTRRETT